MTDKEGDTPEKEVTPDDRVADLTKKLQGIEDNWKNEQRVSASKQAEINALQSRISDMSYSDETSQAMMALLAQQSGRSEEEVGEAVQANKPDLLRQFQGIQAKAKADRQQEDARKIGERYQRQVEDLGLTAKDKVYREVYQYVRDGNYEFADAVIAEQQTEKAKMVKLEGTEEERFEKRLKEKEREWMEKNDMLSTDTSAPSGPMRDFAEKEQAYGEGKVSFEEYNAARKAAKIE